MKSRDCGSIRGIYWLCGQLDDWIEPDMYECLLTALINENVDTAMCGRFEDSGESSRAMYHGFDEGRHDKTKLMQFVYPNMMVNKYFFEWGNFPGLWDKLFRRECLEDFQMAVDERLAMGEDAACVYPCLLQADSIFILHECLYHYRQTTSSMVKKVSDTTQERQRFQILYQTVLNSFSPFHDTYGICRQWREYVLFLMVPRANILYYGMEELDYLFPFSGVKKGSRIILYGLGIYGQFLYRYLEKTHFCRVVAVADRNHAKLQEQGFEAIPPEAVGEYEYEAIVVAVSFYKMRMSIYKELSARCPKEKIHMMDETLIKSSESLRMFGLI